MIAVVTATSCIQSTCRATRRKPCSSGCTRHTQPTKKLAKLERRLAKESRPRGRGAGPAIGTDVTNVGKTTEDTIVKGIVTVGTGANHAETTDMATGTTVAAISMEVAARQIISAVLATETRKISTEAGGEMSASDKTIDPAKKIVVKTTEAGLMTEVDKKTVGDQMRELDRRTV